MPDNQINSLMDLIGPQAANPIPASWGPAPEQQAQDVSTPVGGGMPADVAAYYGGGGGGGGPTNPGNWFMSRGDLQSPLQYMASTGNSPFVPGQWAPNDQGGYFTLNQLYGGTPGGVQSLPGIYQHGSNMPSTNNWRLTLPYGGGQGAILRNGQVIWPGHEAARGQMRGSTGAGVTGSGEDVGSTWNIPVNPGAALSGNNVWAGQYWPGGAIFGYPFGTKGGT